MADDAIQDQLKDDVKPITAPSKGTCRICFEDDGDLIAPCKCSGTSKWIHRSCLNRWRVSGSNPASLTQCCECKFQYELELHRICDLRSEEMRRQFFRQLLSHSVLWFMGVQLFIIVLGVIIKFFDKKDALVAWFPFENLSKVYGFFPDLQHYAFTYYFAGVLAFLLLTGLLVLGVACCGLTPPMHECGACVDGCELCCMACNPIDLCRCADLPAIGCAECLQVCLVSSGPEMLLIVGVFIAAAIVIIGLIAALATLVLMVQRVFQRYVRLREMGMLAEEYSVKDLAAPQQQDQGVVAQQVMEQGEPQKPEVLDEASQEEVQRLVQEELRVIFGGSMPRAATAPLRQSNTEGYGTTASTTDYREG